MEIEHKDDVLNDNGSGDIASFAAERCCATNGNYRKAQLRLLLPWICLLVIVRGTVISLLRGPMTIAVLCVALFFLPLFTALRLALLPLRHHFWRWRIALE